MLVCNCCLVAEVICLLASMVLAMRRQSRNRYSRAAGRNDGDVADIVLVQSRFLRHEQIETF